MLKQPADAQIRHHLSQIADAWAHSDPDRYASLFTEDADYTAFDGTRMAGRTAIADGHRALFAGIMRGSRMTMGDLSIRHIAQDVVVVCGLGGIVMRWQRNRTEPSAKRVSAVTWVLVHQRDDWQATAFQNTRYRPWSQTFMGRWMTRMAQGETR